MSNFRATFFNLNANAHKNRASTLLGQQFDTLFTPYYTPEYHGISILYPFCHATKAIVSAARVLQGGLLLLGALVNDPKTSVPEVLGGILNEVATTVLNVLNMAASIVSFFTRTLATLFNFGYTANNGNFLKGKEFGGRNEETMLNMFAGFGLALVDQVASITEQGIYVNTTALTL